MVRDTYLFLLIPHNCGSTVVHKVLDVCEKAVCLKDDNNNVVEGYHLIFGETVGCKKTGRISLTRDDIIMEKVAHFQTCKDCAGKLLMPHDLIYEANRNFMNPAKIGYFISPDLYNWGEIIRIWEENWTKERKRKGNTGTVFIDKGIYNLLIPELLFEQFSVIGNVSFIISIRNPYAVCEGIKRRTRLPVEEGVLQWIRLAYKQRENERRWGGLSTVFTYEEMCEEPERVAGYIVHGIPALSDICFDQEVTVHAYDGIQKRKVSDLNEIQIGKLSAKEVEKINEQLVKHRDIVEHWGYKILWET